MKQVTLGRTGLRVKKLGFGGIPIQRLDDAEAVETVRYAVETGIDFIDTSRRYTTSEMRIGMALKQTDKPVVLASKTKGLTSDEVRTDLEMSLKTLQKDYIDLYQCHNPKGDEYLKIISRGGAIEGLIRAKEEGLIGHIGITGHSLDLMNRVLEKARSCSECGEGMTRCPYHLPIPELIKENLQWADSLLKSM